jgi:hypothetical protein
LVQGVSERLAQPGFFRQRRAFLYQPAMQGGQQRFASGLPGCQTLCCREPAYGFLNSIQLTDSF